MRYAFFDFIIKIFIIKSGIGLYHVSDCMIPYSKEYKCWINLKTRLTKISYKFKIEKRTDETLPKKRFFGPKYEMIKSGKLTFEKTK